MRVNHQLINISQLSKITGIDKYYMHSKLKKVHGKNIDKFTPQEQSIIKEKYIELFEYIFEIDYIEIEKFINERQ